MLDVGFWMLADSAQQPVLTNIQHLTSNIRFLYRFPRQNPQRWGLWDPSPATPCSIASCASCGSCGLGSGLETAWGAGAARRGSLRCLSRASAGAETGFLSGSVAVARAVS